MLRGTIYSLIATALHLRPVADPPGTAPGRNKHHMWNGAIIPAMQQCCRGPGKPNINRPGSDRTCNMPTKLTQSHRLARRIIPISHIRPQRAGRNGLIRQFVERGQAHSTCARAVHTSKLGTTRATDFNLEVFTVNTVGGELVARGKGA